MSGPAFLGALLILLSAAAPVASPVPAIAAPPAPATRAAAPKPAPDLAGVLPALKGWTASGLPLRYTPETLYEYIDGAADGFIDADFRDLVSQQYEAPGGRSLTVDLFRHADADSAFGMYSQERPARGPFLAVGAQGYHERGILNFWKGDCYVKLAAFGLGDGDREGLLAVASAVAARIPGEGGMPRLLGAFPEAGKVAGSERFLRRNVLGYPFLERAFTAQYLVKGKELAAFILASGDAARAGAMLAEYQKVQGIAGAPEPGTRIAFQDRHHGALVAIWSGPYLVVVAGDPAAGAEVLLEGVRKGLDTP